MPWAASGSVLPAWSAFARRVHWSVAGWQSGAEVMDQARREALLEAALGGDAKAINHLLAACQPDIRRYAQRNCMISDVDDAIQESLLILSPRVSSLRAVTAFSS